MKDDEVLKRLTAEEIELISSYSRRVKESQEQLQRYKNTSNDDSLLFSGDTRANETKNPALKLNPVIFNETERPMYVEGKENSEFINKDKVQPKRRVLVNTNDEDELCGDKSTHYDASFHPNQGTRSEIRRRYGQSLNSRKRTTKAQKQPFHTRTKSNTKASLNNSKVITRSITKSNKNNSKPFFNTNTKRECTKLSKDGVAKVLEFVSNHVRCCNGFPAALNRQGFL